MRIRRIKWDDGRHSALCLGSDWAWVPLWMFFRWPIRSVRFLRDGK